MFPATLLSDVPISTTCQTGREFSNPLYFLVIANKGNKVKNNFTLLKTSAQVCQENFEHYENQQRVSKENGRTVINVLV
jgi:hypothetical protein